jgi:hypothetical protein
VLLGIKSVNWNRIATQCAPIPTSFLVVLLTTVFPSRIEVTVGKLKVEWVK